VTTCILGYEPVWIDTPGSHRVREACKDELLAAMYELKPRRGARLVVLGEEVVTLSAAERLKLLSRVGFVPADGGLQSSLNGWENISLPLAYHAPQKLDRAFAEVHELIGSLGGVDGELLAKLPEDMTLYEKRLAAFLRALLEKPELVVAENLAAGLGPTKRARTARFASVYEARCPGGTYVQFDG
jgi:ABC-type transporter Mla maintaining outer membrane lipid asymmetry ATPase subunit MlaF